MRNTGTPTRRSAALRPASTTNARTPPDTRIGFTCARADHANASGSMTLTIHRERWAFCRSRGATWEHRWVPAGGVALRMLLLQHDPEPTLR